MPRLVPRLPTVPLAKDLRAAIRRGHPWIYDRAVARMPRLSAGERVVVTHQGARLAVGYADPDRPIVVRILDGDPGAAIDAGWVTRRAVQAARCRLANPHLAHTNAVRAIHGENDFMPGLVVDLYNDTGVVVFDGLAAAAFWAPHIPAVAAGLAAAGLRVTRLWARALRDKDAAAPPTARSYPMQGVLHGDEPPETIEIYEHGARFEVDVRRGQKTGLFLDQRDNRLLVGELSAGARVLNAFSYTGGFSVHAALGGAREVTSVDVARPAMAAAERNFALSGLSPRDHRFVASDAFAFLESAKARGQRYDLVILDPPSFAPSERTKARGLKAYRRLNRMGLDVVEPGGLLITASCSSHVSAADMAAVLAAAASDCGRRTRVIEVRGAAGDHPVAPAFPEGHYLSVLVVYVD